MKLNFKSVVAPALILCAICIVVTGLLGVTNALTKDKIVAAQAKAEENSRLVVLSDAESFDSGESGDYYIGKKGDETVGYVFVTESSGYGGKVKVMTGIGSDGNIKGIVILSNSETPGLGANCTKESFTDQYKQAAGEISVVKNQTAGEGQVEAITGATITTRAVTNAVNLAVEKYNQVKEVG